ncbi:leptin receptor-like isoform X1 [Myxocyprinus asiaticus]|uniref:leptin receptor-like isoform X1 n=2 Tax=Myxocyprinus asiaticus TaxID=70543 RepID=UPI0022239035|nr:leptin receptor-like isoform X1 [Myxocyprinus asiaticus]XP_051568746.1 leptin receptor-like isoform X1 [Myxocyprinus asiaticus]XP_051568747.1 leptin receptor-like isoform X1 [Myxocyprinus asiaticus]XP_051568748.1 leptin receptor-like isoform X1 [Myxocyprinus asiaticus]
MMSLFIRLALLVNFITISQVLAALSPADGEGGVYEDLKWKAQLCCGLPLAQTVGSELTTVTSGLSEIPPTKQCQLLDATNPEPSSKSQTLSGHCLEILCWFESDQANMICNAKSHRAAVPVTESLVTVSPQQLVLEMGILSNETKHTAQCAGEETATCSTSLHGNEETVSLFISISVNGTSVLSPKMLINTFNLRKPDPPVNLHCNVTAEGQVILRWNGTQTDSDTVNYEVRYSSNSSLHHWEVMKVTGRSWMPLNELSSGIRYMVQVRCQNQLNYWSEWSQTFSFILDVSYIPAEVFTIPGSEVTVYAIFHNRSWSASKAVWMLNGQVEIPESQYKVINEQVSAVTLKADQPGFHTLMCCYSLGKGIKGSIAYAKIYTEGMFNANITCQSKNSKVDTMTCEWNKSPWAMVRFLYRQYKSMCEDIPKIEDGEESMSLIKEGIGPGDHRECTLSNLSLFSCYKMWVEVEGGRGKVRSFPVYVAPIDYVKPSPPTILKAITLPNKTLSLWWRRPSLPVYDMQYELRFVALRGKADMQWEVIGPLLELQAEILLEQSCVRYKVQVRCRRLNGSGYWSDWSKSHTSIVYNRKAPEMGPDFWRIIQEDPERNATNVTLIFKPAPAGDPYSCVEGLLIVHQASGGAVWSNETTLVSFHSFQWKEDAHTVTVMSRNALGISTRNSNMTLLHQPKRRCVRSFSVVANASCVYLSWTLLSDQPMPNSFVIEWLDLNKDTEQDRSLTERIQWVRVQSTSRDLSLCRRFYGSEEFTLYPMFVDGEWEPVRCTATRGDPAAYMLLMIIAFLSVVLFVTLMISQNQMRKLMWKDVPNPNNCSWAKGMDFRQIDTMENLFPHPEGLTACPLLLVSESICEVEIIEKPHPPTLEHEKDNEVLLYNSEDTERTTTSSPLLGDSSEPLSLEASSSAATPETSGQSSVTYSNILLSDQPGLLRKQQESLSGSSDEGNFSANNSDISGSFPGGFWDRENHAGSDSANPRHSSSYNSVEEFSETSEQEDDASESTGGAKDLYYLDMNEEEKDVEEKEKEETEFNEEAQTGWEKNEDFPFCKEEIVMGVNPRPLLECKNSTASDSNAASHSIPLYLPQFQTECINPP